MSSDGSIGVDTTPQTERAKELLEGSRSVGTDSKAREDLYVAKAIEDRGLEVDIVGITESPKYQAVLSDNGSSTTQRYDSFDEAINTRSEGSRHFGINYSPTFHVYYKTPLEEIYKIGIPIKLQGYGKAELSPENRTFIESIWKSAIASEHHDSLSDISKNNPIRAQINPGDGFDNGKLIHGDTTVGFSDGKEVEVPRTDGDIDSQVNYCLIDSLERIESDLKSDSTDWYKTYVSDVHESEDGGTVYLEVPRPYRGSSLFPLHVSYDSSDPLWDVLDQAGGDIMDIRGMDVYIRNRGAVGSAYYEFSSNYGYEYVSIENIECQSGRHIVHISDDESPVETITSDVDFMWELGIENNYRKDNPEENPEAGSIINSFIEMLN